MKILFSFNYNRDGCEWQITTETRIFVDSKEMKAYGWFVYLYICRPFAEYVEIEVWLVDRSQLNNVNTIPILLLTRFFVCGVFI